MGREGGLGGGLAGQAGLIRIRGPNRLKTATTRLHVVIRARYSGGAWQGGAAQGSTGQGDAREGRRAPRYNYQGECSQASVREATGKGARQAGLAPTQAETDQLITGAAKCP